MKLRELRMNMFGLFSTVYNICAHSGASHLMLPPPPPLPSPGPLSPTTAVAFLCQPFDRLVAYGRTTYSATAGWTCSFAATSCFEGRPSTRFSSPRPSRRKYKVGFLTTEKQVSHATVIPSNFVSQKSGYSSKGVKEACRYDGIGVSSVDGR